MTLDAEGSIVSANAHAAALFGKRQANFRPSFGELLAPESERPAREYFERVGARRQRTHDKAIDVAARAGDDRLIPLAIDAHAHRLGALSAPCSAT